MLEFRNFSVSIGPISIVNQATFDVGDSEFCGLIGTNGAGKTTLLRGVMGALPSTGRLVFDEYDLAQVPPHERVACGIGYMPEDRRLVPDLTVEENIMLPSWSANLPKSAERLQWILELMPEIGGFRQRPAVELSGGQQKMVALGRSLMAGRRLLILDEPFEGLAPVLARRLAEVLAGLKRERVSVLIAESNLARVGALLDRQFVIERGVVRAC